MLERDEERKETNASWDGCRREDNEIAEDARSANSVAPAVRGCGMSAGK